MKGHLSEIELVDLIEGRLSGPPAAHAATCTGCAARAEGIRETLASGADVRVPEPSPLFWDRLSSRIREAVDQQPQPRPSRGWRLLDQPSWAWAATAVAATAVVGSILWHSSQVGVRPTTQAAMSVPGTGATPVDPGRDVWNEDIETDEAWAVVRAVAEDVGLHEASEAGIAVRPQSVDHVVAELSNEERSELARLIEAELKRTGA